MALATFTRFDPFDGLARLQAELDRWLDNPAFGFGPTGATVYPAVNVFTDPEGLVVRAEVAGVKAEQLTVTAEPGRLTIAGERTPDPTEKGSYHRRERQFGKFSRTIRLPDDIDPSAAAAECRNGLLTVRIPKRAEARPRSIPVQHV
jgi:HSP20 family protein